MKEKKTVFKLFFVWDFEKEERWLNEMAQGTGQYRVFLLYFCAL